MTTDPFAQPVAPVNTGRGRKRRDPDDDPATPQTAAADTTPSAAATTTPTSPGSPAADLAQTPPPAGGTLGPVLAPPTTPTADGGGTGHDSVSVLLGLARMRQQAVDPMADYVTDGTRTLRFVQQAIHQVAQLTGRTRQDVQTRALLGIERLPADVLEANFQAIYGYPRAQYQPPGNHR